MLCVLLGYDTKGVPHKRQSHVAAWQNCCSAVCSTCNDDNAWHAGNMQRRQLDSMRMCACRFSLCMASSEVHVPVSDSGTHSLLG